MNPEWLEQWSAEAEVGKREAAIVGLGILVGELNIPEAHRLLELEAGAHAAEALFRLLDERLQQGQRQSRPDPLRRLHWGQRRSHTWKIYGRSLWPGSVADAFLSFAAGGRLAITASSSASFSRASELPPTWLSGLVWRLPNVSVSLAMRVLWQGMQRARSSWHWPLRIGFLNDSGSRRLREAMIGDSSEWVHRLAVPIDVELTGLPCDLLLSPVGLEATRAALARRRGRATAILLLGMIPAEREASLAAESELVSQSQAAVIGYLPPKRSGDPGGFVPEPNGTYWAPVKALIRSISHDRPLDAAIYDAAREMDSDAPLVLASDEFLDARRLSRLARQWAEALAHRGDSVGAAELRGLAHGEYLRESGPASGIVEAADRLGVREPQPRRLHAVLSSQGQTDDLLLMRRQALETVSHLKPGGWTLLNIWVGPLLPDSGAGFSKFPEDGLFSDGASEHLDIVVTAPLLGVRALPILREIEADPRGNLYFRPRWFSSIRGGDLIPYAISLDQIQDGGTSARRGISIGKDGPSQVASFVIRADAPGEFRARILVVHENRILQTAILHLASSAASSDEALPPTRLEPEGETVTAISDLEDRRPFDLAVLTNDALTGGDQYTLISDNEVVLQDFGEMKDAARRVRDGLSDLIANPADFDGGDDEALRDVLVKLAHEGVLIRDHLRDSGLGRVLDTRPERIQLVAAKPDEILPIEFVYEGPAPEPQTAAICPGQQVALTEGDCGSCPNRESRDHVCATRFWGLSRVIERQLFDPERRSSDRVLTRSAPSADLPRIPRATRRLLAFSNHARSFNAGDVAITGLEMKLRAGACGSFRHATCWKDWRDCIASEQPTLLVALPHTDKGQYGEILEIGDSEQITNAQIDAGCVGSIEPVVVMLMGCSTAAQEVRYASFLARFRAAKASVVIGTLTPVLGRHAIPVASALVEELDAYWNEAEENFTIGDAIAQMRRRLFERGLPAGLSVVAFGDADWLLGQ